MLVGVNTACRQPSNAAPSNQQITPKPGGINARAATDAETRDATTANAITEPGDAPTVGHDFAVK